MNDEEVRRRMSERIARQMEDFLLGRTRNGPGNWGFAKDRAETYGQTNPDPFFPLYTGSTATKELRTSKRMESVTLNCSHCEQVQTVLAGTIAKVMQVHLESGWVLVAANGCWLCPACVSLPQ